MAEPAQLSVRMVVAQMCARVPGGTGRYAEDLLRALACSRPDGAWLDAVAGRPCAALRGLPVPVGSLRLPDPLLARLWERGLPPWPARGGVVHAPTLLLPPPSGRYRLVATVHDVVPWTHPRTLTRRGVAFHHRMGDRAAREAALVVTPTQAVADQVRNLLSPRAPVVAVHPGVPIRTVPPDADERRARRGLPRGYVLFVGTAEPRKGLDVLMTAMTRPGLAQRHLVVAGPTGWGGVGVLDLARDAGVSDRVHPLGRVTDADLAAVYAGARVLAMPSRAEGFGFPVVEAMTYGIPVVTSDDSALVEVGAGAARVVAREDPSLLADALAEMAEESRERTEMVERGTRRVQDFSWAAAADRMWALYADVSVNRG